MAIAIAKVCHAENGIGVNDVFGQYGFHSEDEQKSGGTCQVKMTLDQAIFIGKVPDLQKIGLLNQDMSEEKINSSPYSLSMAFMIQMSSATTKDFYDKNTKADRCQFAGAIVVPDDYGHTETINAITYDFDRKLYEKIDWEHFQDQKMVKVAYHFKFNPAILMKVRSETDQ